MAFNLSENTAREIQSAFEAFRKSEDLVSRQFVQDLHDVHIKAAMAYSFLRAEAEQAGVSLSSSSLWKDTSFAGKDYKDYRAFMASAKIIRPYAFTNGMSGAMSETYQRDMKAHRVAALRKRLERLKGTNHDDT